MFDRKKLALLVAEFLGTAILTLTYISVRSSGIGYPFFVAIGAGLAVGVLMLVLGAVSGGHFNPALTIGLWTNGKVKTAPAVVYVAMQLLGGAVAYWVYSYLVKNHVPASTSGFEARVMLAEALGAFIFVVGWCAAAAQKFVGIKLAAAAGGAYALAVMIASFAANGLANPAVALGTRSWVWSTYVLGPVVGAIVGVNFYNLLFTENGTKSWKTALKSANKKK